MEEITTTSEGLTEDLLSRLAIVEELDGEEMVVTIEKSSILLSGQTSASFRISVSAGEDSEFAQEMPELLKASPYLEFMARSGLSAANIRATIILPSDDYVIPVPFVVLTGLILKKSEQGQEGAAIVPLFRLTEYAQLMGMQPPPLSQLPLGVVVAIVGEDEEELSALKERLRAAPSKFGSSSHKPRYRVVLVDPQTKEEGNLQWRI
jgi:hypothetical protein